MLPTHPNPLAIATENSTTRSTERVPTPPSSQVSCGTWSEDGRLTDVPDEPALDPEQVARRARLARVVRGVVVASALVCVAALGRATVSWASGAPPEVSHAARVSMRDQPVIGTFRTIHDDATPDGRSKHSKRAGRATASRSRPW
jgi:hypothetical protein